MKELNVSLENFEYSFSHVGYDIFYNVIADDSIFDFEYVVVDESGEVDCTDCLKTAIGVSKLWNLIYSDYESRFEEYY